MRGRANQQETMLSLIVPDQVIPKNHPLRAVKALADEVLRAMEPLFDEMYSDRGRESVPPERLLKATLLMALFTIRSERQVCEHLKYNLLYRWFLDMDMDLTKDVFDPTVFTKNRKRLMDHHAGKAFMANVVQQADRAGLMSSEHFTVDGTLIEACASLKSFKRKDGTSQGPDDDDKGNPTVNFHGEKRSNQTHESKTDREARLMRKSNGTTAKLSFAGHALMENANGLLVDVMVTQATGTAEREAAWGMLSQIPGDARITVGADKAYDVKDFVAKLRDLNVTPHIAQNKSARRSSAIDNRTTRHPGFAISQRCRKLVEESFGWGKTVGGLRRTRFRGVERTNFAMQMIASAYNLLKMTKLMATGDAMCPA
jgi:transposase